MSASGYPYSLKEVVNTADEADTANDERQICVEQTVEEAAVFEPSCPAATENAGIRFAAPIIARASPEMNRQNFAARPWPQPPDPAMWLSQALFVRSLGANLPQAEHVVTGRTLCGTECTGAVSMEICTDREVEDQSCKGGLIFRKCTDLESISGSLGGNAQLQQRLCRVNLENALNWLCLPAPGEEMAGIVIDTHAQSVSAETCADTTSVPHSYSKDNSCCMIDTERSDRTSQLLSSPGQSPLQSQDDSSAI